MPKNKVQQRARAKRDRERVERRRAQRRRTIRIWTTVLAVVALAVGLTLSFATGSKKKSPLASASNSPSASPSASATPSVVACGGKPRGAYRGTTYRAAPPMTVDKSKSYTATLVTSCGTIKIALDPKQAPVTVNNFVFLARAHFYDNTIFHRVIPQFMMQGGDPQGTGTGGPGYKFKDETYPSDKFDKPGILAMANAGPNTNGSQFFITQVPYPSLNGHYTIFGHVISGQQVVDKVMTVPRNGESPSELIVLYSVTIAEK